MRFDFMSSMCPQPVSEAEGGSTSINVIYPINLTEPQGKIKR